MVTSPVRVALRLAEVATEVDADHPLRAVKAIADDVLARAEGALLELASSSGAWGIPVSRLLKAKLLMVLYGVRNAAVFCEQIPDNVGLRWFLDLDGAPADAEGRRTAAAASDRALPEADMIDARSRLASAGATGSFLAQVLTRAHRAGLLEARGFTMVGHLGTR